MKITGTLLIGLAAAGLSACGLQPNENTMPFQPGVGSDGYTVHVAFKQIENLVANSPVEWNDTAIGTVTAISLNGWSPEVTLRLKKSVPIPANATFSIGQKTLLGAQYVEIDAPPRPVKATLSAGATIPAAQTGSYPETEQVLASAALLLNNGGLSQISTITSQLNDAFRGRVPNARSLISQLQGTLAKVDKNKAQILATISAVNSLAHGLAQDRSQLATAIDALSPAITTLNNNLPQLVSALDQAATLSNHGSTLISAAGQSLNQTVANLRNTVQNLRPAAATLPNALNFLLTIPFPLRTTPKAVLGDYANLFATLDLTALPTLPSTGTTGSTATQATNPLANPLSGLTTSLGLGSILKGTPLATSIAKTLPPEPGATSSTTMSASNCGILSVLGIC